MFNLFAEAFADNRSLGQIIEGAVIRHEVKREASTTHTMDKLLFEAFVEFSMRTEQENEVKFLFDVCQYRHLCELAIRFGDHEIKGEKVIDSGTSDRRFKLLFCIMAEYIMPKGIKEIQMPKEMQDKAIVELCEYLDVGTVSHLEGMPSLGRFFELRHEQLIKYSRRSEIIKDISMRIFGEFDEPKVTPKEIQRTLFDDMVFHISDQVQELYEDFRNKLVDL